MKWFKSKKEIIAQAKKELKKEMKPENTDKDFARLESIVGLVNKLNSGNSNQGMGEIFKQMTLMKQFEKGIVDLHETELDTLAEQMQESGGDSDDIITPELLKGLIGGVLNKNTPLNPTYTAPPVKEQIMYIPPETNPIMPVELDAVTKALIPQAKKKIPKAIRSALASKSDAEKLEILKQLED